MSNKIDLHIHSAASDGTDSIPQILKKIQDSRIHTFSITDHDTIEGSQLMEKLVPKDFCFLRGIEFSCITPYKKCHILGYNYDSDDSCFQDALELGKKLRREKVELRIDFLKEKFGIVLTEEELNWLNQQPSPGKPTFGQLLVKRGLTNDIDAAIKQYINPCKTANDRIDADVAVKAILHSGGIPVWAHPLGGEGERRLTADEFKNQLNELISYGIQGLECHYSRYAQEEVAFLVEQANKHHLMISGGSDYHGSNKKNITLGKLNADNVDVDSKQITLYWFLKDSMVK